MILERMWTTAAAAATPTPAWIDPAALYASDLEIEIVACAEGDGVYNANAIRLDATALELLARTSEGKPFMLGHGTMRGGWIINGRLRLRAGATELIQRVHLTDPTFVRRAAHGLMRGVSIGFHGIKYCSLCGPRGNLCGPIGSDEFALSHRQGKLLEGGIRVERVYAAAMLKETSDVEHPAVSVAHVALVKPATELTRLASRLARIADDLQALEVRS